ncbi:ABC transporter permease [Amycolatopsis samaneae]|uniref:ABC transporter permease n=1 Tax=Amycolatopsis samaneae TaxID=664691 RepID=A0ABW5GG07_9PSEU
MNGLIRSEWTKLRSLRSTWLTLVGTAVLCVGLGTLIARGQASAHVRAAPADRPAFDPTALSLSGIFLAQLTIGVLGVLVMTSEYSTGMIQSSLTVVPRRGRLYVAKICSFGAFALLSGQVIGFASFLLGQALIAGAGAPHTTLADPGVFRAVVGSGLYLALLGLLGLALGAMVRATAGALALLVTITLLVRLVSATLPATWQQRVNQYWPTSAGTRITTVVPDSHSLAPWAGFGVLCAFTAACLLGGFALLRARDV